MKLSAPAKVNLHLSVHGRRPDGFHDIETLIVPLSLHDEVTVELMDGKGVEIHCDHAEVPADATNLAVVAAGKVFRHTGLQAAVRITIRKNIPPGAGLGGGSSDAAAVLIALNQLLETGLSFASLESIAAEIGSDVPFFVRARPATCRGRGEIIEPHDRVFRLRLLLIKPPFGIPTAWAYAKWKAEADAKTREAAQAVDGVELFNDLEGPVFGKFLILPVLKKWLREQPQVRGAAMSGSGSTVFAILGDDANAEELAQRALARFGHTFWTATCETRSGREE